ncbi:MAG: hypothetical protein LBC72_04050 [Spirochaetaceae bacterium]|jgi:hypothetical protein|nr:hypothetical protein [Spirochaetaceae bacterium]
MKNRLLHGSALNRVLAAVLCALLAGIAAVSAWKLRPRPAESAGLAGAGAGEAAAGGAPAGDVRIWTGIGRLRCPLKPARGAVAATAVLSVAFPYDYADSAFTAELARNNVRFRAETAAFFATLERASPLLLDEGALKQALLERFNRLLQLGAIEQLFFPDFMLIE